MPHLLDYAAHQPAQFPHTTDDCTGFHGRAQPVARFTQSSCVWRLACGQSVVMRSVRQVRGAVLLEEGNAHLHVGGFPICCLLSLCCGAWREHFAASAALGSRGAAWDFDQFHVSSVVDWCRYSPGWSALRRLYVPCDRGGPPVSDPEIGKLLARGAAHVEISPAPSAAARASPDPARAARCGHAAPCRSRRRFARRRFAWPDQRALQR